ncbi:hypothetical protein, partial [Rhizobium acidisoli]|uniref:hypothetical protein n=1 Tax=Rhizobium acidisoli TaxID=1538158 RepID=UPI000A6F5A93
MVAPLARTAIANEHLKPAYRLILDLSVSSEIDICPSLLYFPDQGRFWEVIDKHKVNIFYTAPTA